MPRWWKDPQGKGGGGSNSSWQEDYRREGRADAALGALATGRSLLATSADHLTGELCTECIVRLQNTPSKTGVGIVPQGTVGTAIQNLKDGIGHHANSASHTGGNRCVEVLAAATS